MTLDTGQTRRPKPTTEKDKTMTLLNMKAAKYTKTEASRIATALQSGELDGWSYRVEDDPEGSGASVVSAYDDEGFVGFWAQG